MCRLVSAAAGRGGTFFFWININKELANIGTRNAGYSRRETYRWRARRFRLSATRSKGVRKQDIPYLLYGYREFKC